MRTILALTLPMLLLSSTGRIAAAESHYQNLRVLPEDISRSELGERMLENTLGLGLPRLAGEGCLYCHVGDLDTPRRDWDYASDSKPMKAKARVMMAMVKEINGEHLAKLDRRTAPDLRVTCATCHAGRTDPRPLPDVLLAAWTEGGMDAVSARYRQLRERYLGADAYDFRVDVLPGIASSLADRGAIDDAIALAQLNREAHPDRPEASRAWVAFRLERTIDTEGVDAALAELDRLASTLETGVMVPELLDALAWRLIRSDREAAGRALVEANHRRFPDEYRALESLAFVYSSTGRKPEALALLERWLAEHPDHDRARNLLVNLRDKE